MENGKVTKNLIPDKIFIVPYRNREPHKMVFNLVMKEILKEINYKIIYVHQKDNRPFNRGAIKNIGFLYGIECKFRNVKQGIYEMFQIQQKVLKEKNA